MPLLPTSITAGADVTGTKLFDKSANMPSYPLSQFSDLEEMMCKQLLNLDLTEQSRPLPSLSLAMRTPGYIGQPRSNSSFSLSSLSCLAADPPDSVFLTSSQWGQQSESPLPSQLANPTQWGKSGFLGQRSISMVETSSATAANLEWPGTDMKHSQSDLSPTALNTSSSSSSSSRYKTELCRSFTESGLCKYGGKCQFAHGAEELRDLSRHPKYKTEPCRTFHTIGFCPYGIRCHFVHNNEEEKKHSISRSSSSSSSSSSSIPQQPPVFSRSHRPPLVRQSFSFAGFPSAPQQPAAPALPATASFTRAPSASPPSCADITDLLSHAFLEMDSAFEASPAQYQPPIGQATTADPRSPFLPSPDSGCSPCGRSPTASPSLRQSPGASGVFSGPLGARSLSYTSLSDQDQDGSSSASSLSGSECCGGINDANGRRLAVFSQLSVPEDATGFCL
ncbi:mRNA decay activator protein ZFP36L1 isoform X1 [Larimichthys crocea]|uniref:mRNA decay activator protein ZFP36L1 isoform X1 n=1 Tax=Larimichthys crocea TaxID=215358 RepID=UPI000F5EC9A4|nr:mRNA decay activator protein ZFP36L1 isoform X1 [Larimichthys crocea]